jgi:hypothetical protein
MSPIYVPGKVTLRQTYVAGDQYFNETSLLLHCNGANGSTTITDSSRFANTVTAVGNAQISTTQSKFGGASIAFDGTGDYVQLLNSDLLAFGTGDYTIEMWIYGTDNATGRRIIELSGNGEGNLAVVGTTIQYYNGTFNDSSSSNVIVANSWQHIALSRQAGTARVYVDGTVRVSRAAPLSTSQRSLYIGGLNAVPFVGYMDEIRITKGVARYTANFTPPTAPFADGYY